MIYSQGFSVPGSGRGGEREHGAEGGSEGKGGGCVAGVWAGTERIKQ
jgi:hypothetical protein